MKLLTFFKKNLWMGLLLCGLFFAACQETPSTEDEESPTPAAAVAEDEIVMRQYQGDRSLNILYPAAWTFHLPRTGILMFATADTIEQMVPGPLMTVLRVSSAQVHGNAEGELNHYLDFGPLRSGFTLNQEEYGQLLIDGQEGWDVFLTHEGDEENIPMEAYIVSVETESGAVYIFSSTAPAEMWPDHEETFRVMVNSVDFTE